MNKFLQIFKITELRKKIFSVLGFLVLFRALAAIPIPGVNVARLQEFLASNQIFGFLNLFSGGGLSNLSVAMLGVGPYITAVIIMQLLTIVFPKLKEYYYGEGSEGRSKFNRYTRYLSVPLAAVQSYGFLNLLISQQVVRPLGISQLLTNVVVITAGSTLLMWIGELISEQDLGNGISIIIFSGILAGLPQTISSAIANYTPSMLPTYLAFVVLAIVVTAGIVVVNEGERKVPVSYAKQVRGNKMYGGASSYLPIKANQAGVIPIIFAVSVLLFPQFLAQAASMFSAGFAESLNNFVTGFFNNSLIYSLVYFVLVVGFTYFYTAVTFDPEEISKNLQRRGGFIPGIRPGEETKKVLTKIVNRVTLTGALFLGFVAVLPNITQMLSGVSSFAVGGIALLIVVSVGLEIMKKVQSQLTMREYEGIM
ncbi:MAG: preprotein translocase subunit SecY [Candidatus Magasanikbacteria bacterium]